MYIYKVRSGNHYAGGRKIAKGQIFKSNHDLQKAFQNKFDLVSKADGKCVEGEVIEAFDISTPPKVEKKPVPPKVEKDDDTEEVTTDNSVDDTSVSDDDTSDSDEDVSEDVEDDDEDDEEDEEVVFELPMRTTKLSPRKFNVLDANGVQVNDSALSRKGAIALIKSYEEDEEAE